MPKEEVVAEIIPKLKSLLREGNQAAGGLLSAGALGVAGGAGALYALEHHGRVKAEKTIVSPDVVYLIEATTMPDGPGVRLP